MVSESTLEFKDPWFNSKCELLSSAKKLFDGVKYNFIADFSRRLVIKHGGINIGMSGDVTGSVLLLWRHF